MGNIRDDAESMDRRQASRALGKARRSIEAIRNFYIANIMLSALVLGVFWLAEASMPYLAGGVIALGVMVTGYIQIQKQPYVWSIVIACIWTAIMGLASLGGVLSLNLYTFLGGVWTAGCWMMVPTTKKANDLLEQYPDLWVSKKMATEGTGRKRRR